MIFHLLCFSCSTDVCSQVQCRLLKRFLIGLLMICCSVLPGSYCSGTEHSSACEGLRQSTSPLHEAWNFNSGAVRNLGLPRLHVLPRSHKKGQTRFPCLCWNVVRPCSYLEIVCGYNRKGFPFSKHDHYSYHCKALTRRIFFFLLCPASVKKEGLNILKGESYIA